MSLLSTTFFAGAVSKANTAIANTKFQLKQTDGDAATPDIYTLTLAAAMAAFQELVNMETITLATASAKSGLIEKESISGLTIMDSMIVLACNLVVKDVMKLYNEDIMPIEVVKSIWLQNTFVSKRWKRVNSTDGVGKLKSIDELNKENDEAISKGASNECEGGACKL